MEKDAEPQVGLDSQSTATSLMQTEGPTDTEPSFPEQLLQFTRQQKQILSSPRSQLTSPTRGQFGGKIGDMVQVPSQTSPYADSGRKVHFSQSVDYLTDVSSVTESSSNSTNAANSPAAHPLLLHGARRTNSESTLSFYAQDLVHSVAFLEDGDPERQVPETKRILSDSLASALRAQLPPLARIENHWRLVYCTDRDGFSLKTLYGATKRHQNSNAKCLLIVQDMHNCMFGAFLTEAPVPHLHHYGTGECFIWRARQEGLQVYRSTGINDYYIMSEPTFLAVGCSEGQFGIWLDGLLRVGTSGPVATFNNEPGCVQGREFRCKAIQLWLI